MSQLEEKTGRFVAFCQGPHSNLEAKWIPRYMTSFASEKNFMQISWLHIKCAGS